MIVVDKHAKKEFSAIMSDAGVVLCDKTIGAFIVLRYSEDVIALREMLDNINVAKFYEDEK